VEFFNCNYNLLTTKHCPNKIDDDFSCTHNKLSSLLYCTKQIAGTLIVVINPSNNRGCPGNLLNFDCCNNKLETYLYYPKIEFKIIIMIFQAEQ
jgi:hypothetical protein